MSVFNVNAHQEMTTEVTVEAADAREAVRQFKALLAGGKIEWRPSDEGMDMTVLDEDGNAEEVFDESE